MKRLVFICIFVLTLFVTPLTVSAQRYAECDACGYCLNREEPQSWKSCARCLYPEAVPTGSNIPASANKTLEIKGDERGIQITQAPGKYYTQIGCIDTSMESFQNPSASGGVLNFMLNSVIFPVVGVLAFFSLLYGAFLLMTAQGAYEQIQRGKSFIVGSLVGLLFAFGSVFIVRFIAGDILKIPGFSSAQQAAVSVRAETATVGGKVVGPEIILRLDGKDLYTKILPPGTQTLDVDIPIKLDLTNPAELDRLAFHIKADHCYTSSTVRNSTCCDPITWQSLPQTHQHWKRCNDRVNYNGDVNLYFNTISIEGKTCTGFTLNGNPTTKPAMSSTGQYVKCTSVAN